MHAGPVFVGRQRELAELRAGLEDAVGGRGRFFLVVGEAGIGKTRLAEELAREAAERGGVALWGRCWEGEGAPPYWPWVQVIRALLQGVPAEELRPAVGAGAPYLVPLVPGLGEEEVRRFLEETIGRSPAPVLVRAVHRETEGNPFFVDEIVRLLVAERALERHEDPSPGRFPVPQGVREAIRRRLAPLPPPAREALALASVVGREFDLAILHRACGLDPEALLETLGPALAREIVVREPGGRAASSCSGAATCSGNPATGAGRARRSSRPPRSRDGSETRRCWLAARSVSPGRARACSGCGARSSTNPASSSSRRRSTASATATRGCGRSSSRAWRSISTWRPSPSGSSRSARRRSCSHGSSATRGFSP